MPEKFFSLPINVIDEGDLFRLVVTVINEGNSFHFCDFYSTVFKKFKCSHEELFRSNAKRYFTLCTIMRYVVKFSSSDYYEQLK